MPSNLNYQLPPHAKHFTSYPLSITHPTPHTNMSSLYQEDAYTSPMSTSLSTYSSARNSTAGTTASITEAPLTAAQRNEVPLIAILESKACFTQTQMEASHAREMEQGGFTLVDPKKTYAAAVHATSQRVTGRSNNTGTARRPVATIGIKGVLTTAINEQQVIQSVLVVPQSREQHNQKLHKALYKVFKVKQLPATPEVKRTPVKPAEPLKIKAIFTPGHHHIYGVNHNRKEDEHKSGHCIVPPSS